MKMITLFLTCGSAEECKIIASKLCEEKLITCARMLPVVSTFRWEGEVQESDEFQIIMESREDLFDAIDQLVGELHSYKQYVLTAYPVINASKGVPKWLTDELLPTSNQ